MGVVTRFTLHQRLVVCIGVFFALVAVYIALAPFTAEGMDCGMPVVDAVRSSPGGFWFGSVEPGSVNVSGYEPPYLHCPGFAQHRLTKAGVVLLLSAIGTVAGVRLLASKADDH